MISKMSHSLPLLFLQNFLQILIVVIAQMFIPDTSKVLAPDVDVHKLDLSEYPQFDGIYASGNRKTHNFSTFDTAYSLGKRLAIERGFQIRINKTGFNRKEGIIYKYICCQKEGRSEASMKTKDGAARKRKRDSVRCDCKWTCKLVGLKTTTKAIGQLEFSDVTEEDQDLLWYWDGPEKAHAHNHAMDTFNGFGASGAEKSDSPRPVSRSPLTPAMRETPERDRQISLEQMILPTLKIRPEYSPTILPPPRAQPNLEFKCTSALPWAIFPRPLVLLEDTDTDTVPVAKRRISEASFQLVPTVTAKLQVKWEMRAGTVS